MADAPLQLAFFWSEVYATNLATAAGYMALMASVSRDESPLNMLEPPESTIWEASWLSISDNSSAFFTTWGRDSQLSIEELKSNSGTDVQKFYPSSIVVSSGSLYDEVYIAGSPPCGGLLVVLR